MSQIGTSRPLLEGRSRVLGAERYGTDHVRPGMLHGRLVASPYAHARVDEVSTAAAGAVPGVVAVLTAADLPDVVPASRSRLLLARDRVVFVGHPVALVVAETEAAAQDGAELVEVDYSPLPAATSLTAALAEDAPLVWPGGTPGDSQEAGAHGAESGEAVRDGQVKRPTNVAGRTDFTEGDVESALESSAVVVEHTFETHGVHQSYLEPHATLVDPDPSTGGATVISSTQATFVVRQEVASILGVAESDVRVVQAAVGGAFGGKFLLYDPLVAVAARRLGRPVRLVLNRLEELTAANPAPATRIHMRLGAAQDGSLTALEAEIYIDSGCFPSSMTALAGILLGSPYPLPSFRISGVEVLTFKPSTGAYRAPLAPQVAFALESMVDEVARRSGLDPLEMRLKNAAKPGDPMVHRVPWPSMGMHEVLEALQGHPAWQERDKARERGRGVGIAIGGWPGGTEPAAAACSLERDGTIHVHVGSVDLTGTNTTLAILAAEAFGVEADRVRIITGDTDSSPYAGATGGSKIVYTVGPAVMQAAAEARTQTLMLAAQSFEADPEDLEIVDGKVQVKGAPDKAVPLGTVAARTMRFGGHQAPVWGHGRHANNVPSPAFCAQLAEVEVDAETGEATVHRLIVVQDAGRAINPAAVRGQMMGGSTQGVGWALYEGLVQDADGQIMTGSLMDYAVPKLTHAPAQLETVVVEVPSVLGPAGARGVGEPPVIATAAAVANAIADLTSVRPTRLPMTPSQLLAALEETRAAE